ncbi:MAG: hypothetical protein GY929_23710 [Actinomycetia bacterium]|nr:hypothetical protein [Actinomycetes bacterium]
MGYASDLHRIARIRREALRQISLIEDDDEHGLPPLEELAQAVLEQADAEATDCAEREHN